MGTPVKEPEFGNDCIACWDAGETPKFVYVMFDGVLKGDPPDSVQVPNGHLFKLEQDPASPCHWHYQETGPTWKVSVWRSAITGNWFVTLDYWLVGSHFHGSIDDCPAEQAIFENTYWNKLIRKGYDGVASILWMDEALDLVEALNMPIEGTMMEYFLIDELVPVYKFCNVRYGINQCVELEP